MLLILYNRHGIIKNKKQNKLKIYICMYPINNLILTLFLIQFLYSKNTIKLKHKQIKLW